MKSINSVLNTVVVTFDAASDVIKSSGAVLTNTASDLADLVQAGKVASEKLLQEQQADMRNWETDMKQRCAEHALDAALKLSETKLKIKNAVKNNPELSSILQETLAYLELTDKPDDAK